MRLLILLLFLAAPAFATEPAIGRVNVGGFSTLRLCSGTLVAPATVLTAAHCVTLPDGRPHSTQGMGFVAGWQNGRHLGAASIVEIALHPEAVDADGVVVAHDIAVVRLDRALKMAPFDLGRGGPAGEFALIGYPLENPRMQTQAEACGGEARGDLWLLSCAVSKGMSGGPVIAGADEARRVVGVISSIAGERAVAVPVDDWVIREVARPYTP